MVYIFSEKQIFLTEYFPLTKLMMKANLVMEIDALSNEFVFVTTLNRWFSKIDITELHLIQYCKGVI
jgi:hypothetical protein